MSKSLFSSSWYRVADLKPRLRPHAESHRQIFRGGIWYILQDHQSGQFHRLSPIANLMLCLMDGRRTVREIWEAAARRAPDDPPTQDDTIQLLAQLHSADLLQGELPPDFDEMAERAVRSDRRRLMQQLRNPVAVRIPLFDPDRFLQATLPLVRPLFSVAGFLLWLALVGVALTLAVLHWSELTADLSDRVLATENVALILCVYPVIKSLHELGHAYATRVWGGEVHEIGVMLLVFVPILYVDASASAAFREKRRRIIVGAAGILVETALAAAATIVWLHAAPGLGRSIAFNVMLVGGVSTILFNGNPLLRFDGYYIFSDLIEVPNLGSRASRYVAYLIQKRLFGIEDLDSPVTAPGEAAWFLFYACASFFYRMLVSFGIALFLATKFLVVGFAIAIWSVAAIALTPLYRGLKFLAASPRLEGRRRRAIAIVGALAAAATGVLFLLPIPYATIAEGVVVFPDRAELRARTSGFVRQVEAPSGAPVVARQPLVMMEDPTLEAQIAVIEAQLDETRNRLEAVRGMNRVQAEMFEDEVRRLTSKLATYRDRQRDLMVSADHDGRFLMARAEDLPGRFARRGELLGYVVAPGDPLIQVLVPQSEIDLIDKPGTTVEVRLADDLDRPFAARIRRELPPRNRTCRALRSPRAGAARSRSILREARSRRPCFPTSWSRSSRSSRRASAISGCARMSASPTESRRWPGGFSALRDSSFWASSMPDPGPLPPLRYHPEKAERRETAVDRTAAAIQAVFVSATSRRRARRLRRILPLVERHAAEFSALSTDDLVAAARPLAAALRREVDFPDALTGRAFALIRELSSRVLGKRHFDVQLLGGFAMIRGMLAEMATGEGKTLTANLVAGTAGLAGVPIHVVTVNDYLARRDADLMRPVYERLGLSVGVVVGGQSGAERRAAYACDVVYCTNKEFAFDYLRDRMTLGQSAGDLALKLEALHSASPRSASLRMRGLHFALIDEADSVLVDEARTPLIISGQDESALDRSTVGEALALAESMEQGAEYVVSSEERRVYLTPRGQQRVAAFAGAFSRHFRGVVAREELARQALTAIHLFRRDKEYVVADGKVRIVDEYTGRIMPDRFWSDGLHQLIEFKEGCELSARRSTVARMTYQRFFRRYRRLAGMSGTLQPVARELWRVYRRPVVAIPTAKPVRRIHMPDIVVATDEIKWKAIVERVQALHERGAPVLIGTRTVASSARASAELENAGLPHTVLNALQDSREAEIVAEAGQRGRITVATNMAGRGTDIQLGGGVLELGGLNVIMTERHDARRIDLQLAGRSGRQGEPGSFQAILSLEDPLMDGGSGVALSKVAKLARAAMGNWVGRAMSDYAQRRAERLHARMREQLLRTDQWQMKTLAFTGKPE